MFFIFGWGRTTITDHGSIARIQCGNCSNVSNHHLIKVRRWFTLFFIPVIPYETNYHILCEVCEKGYTISSSEAEKILANDNSVVKEISDKNEEENYWKCPECGNINPNSHYKCIKCHHSII